MGSKEGDPVRLADWAELQILYSGDTGISFESIRTATDVEGLLDEEDSNDSAIIPNEVSEHLIADTVREVERRMVDGGEGYPFWKNVDRLEIRPGAHRWTAYAFCLMVCDRDYWTNSDPSPRMFEHIASTALQSYLQGSSFRFGWPRNAPEQQIKVALERLAEQTGDRLLSVYPVKPTDKDLGLDVVGWKDFADRAASKVLVYMQCATGEDWPAKRSDLDLSPGGVWNQIMGWTTQPVKALAIPYVVSPGDDWERSIPGILLMDRLRISSVLTVNAISIEGFNWPCWFEERVEQVAKFHGS